MEFGGFSSSEILKHYSFIGSGYSAWTLGNLCVSISTAIPGPGQHLTLHEGLELEMINYRIFLYYPILYPMPALKLFTL